MLDIASIYDTSIGKWLFSPFLMAIARKSAWGDAFVREQTEALEDEGREEPIDFISATNYFFSFRGTDHLPMIPTPSF